MTERSIFLAALEKGTPEARTAYLDEACGDNAVLRRQVEALLQEHDGVGNFLEQPAVAPTAIKPTLGADAPGSRVGPYKLLQQIGEGGFGMVYMAEQEHPVRRRVALKIIKPGMDSNQVIARFEAERQALAMMDHQHIARVFDAGKTTAGRPYFVMELVHGIPITKYCDDNHLSLRERLELFIPVGQAIQHAHQKGIIHRDIKPSNVLVTLYDGKPVPKVIDFGVAKAIEQRLTDRTMFTQYGTIVGTFEYMAPEQAEMSALGVDTRSDIYSLGVLLYELLTGSTPLEHKKLYEAAYTEVLRMIKEIEPPKPSTRLSTSATLPAIAAARKTEPSKLARLMRGELDWIVMKCLEKDRARRYETANGLVRDLQRYLADEPVEACPPSAGYRLMKLARKYKRGFVTASAFVMVLIAGVVVSTVHAVRAREAEAEARRERDVAAKAQGQAEAVSRFLTEDLLFEAAPEKNPHANKVTVEEVLRKAAKNIESNPKFDDQPEIEASLRLVIGNTLVKLGQARDAEPHLRRAVELRRKALGPEHLDTLTAQEDLALVMGAELGDFQKAMELARATWEARSRVLTPEHADTLESLDTYCGTLINLGRVDEGVKLYRQCLDGRLRVQGEKNNKTQQTKGNLAWALQRQGNHAEAESLLRQCLQVRLEIHSLEHPDTLPIRNNLGLSQLYLGKFSEAEPNVREALAICRRVNGPKSVFTGHLQHMLVRVLFGAGKGEEAEQLARDTIALWREILPSGHVSTGRTLIILGHLLVSQGKAADAEVLLREAQDIFRNKPGQDDWIALVEVGRGSALAAAGKFEEAESLLAAAWPRFADDNRIPPWQKDRSAEVLAKVYEKAGKRPEAEAWRARVAALTKN
jgi:serine/threonine protein kinase